MARRLSLDPELLERVDFIRNHQATHQLLLDAGLLLELPTPLPEALRPVAEIRQQLRVVKELEERISLLRQPNPFHTGGVPLPVWVVLGGVVAGVFGLWMLGGEALPVFSGGAGLLGALGLTACLAFGWVEVLRRRQARELEAQLPLARREIRDQLLALLTTPLHLELPGAVLECTPHRTWLVHRARETRDLLLRKPDEALRSLFDDLERSAAALGPGEALDLGPLRERLAAQGVEAKRGRLLDEQLTRRA